MTETNTNNSELLAAALQYVAAGWKILPLSGKRPVNGFRWAELRDKAVTAEDVRGWFRTYGDQITGLGLMTGVKAGICILDLEAGEDPKKFNIPHTVHARSGGGGWHYYFSVPSDLPGGALPTTDLRPHGVEGELRADDTYTALPPSVHPSGKQYEWIVPLDRKALAPVSQQLLDLASKKTRQPQNWSEKMAGTTEGGRHMLAVSVVGKLLHHIPRHEWDAIIPPLIKAWNEKCNTPPLPFAELKQIYTSLYRKHASQHTQAPAPERKLLTVSEILKLPDEEKPEFLVQALIPENGISAMSGHPGCGKSWVMLHMAQCIATGTRFLDQIPTKKGNVLIVDEESGVWEMKRRMQLLGYPDSVPVYFYCQNGFKIDKKEDLNRLLKTVIDNDIKLVVFDPFVAIHSKIENNAEDAQAVMEQLQRFNAVGASVLFIHHHRKGGIGGGGLSLRGSSAFSGRLDSHITVTKSDKSLDPIYLDIEHEKSRRGRNWPTFRIALAEDTQNNSVTLTYESGVVKPAAIKKDRAQELILEVLKAGESSTSDIIEAVQSEEEIGGRNIREGLKTLETEGTIASRRDGKQKKYALAAASATDF